MSFNTYDKPIDYNYNYRPEGLDISVDGLECVVAVRSEQAEGENGRQTKLRSALSKIGLGKQERVTEPEVSYICEFNFGAVVKLCEVSRVEMCVGEVGYGAMLPRSYEEDVSRNEAVVRLQQLAEWLDPHMVGSVQEKYEAVAAIKKEYTVKMLEPAQTQQPLEDEENDDVEMSFAQGQYSMTIIKLGVEHREQIESVGLNEDRMSVLTALRRMNEPRDFILRVKEEFEELDAYSRTVFAANKALCDIQTALEVIGETDAIKVKLQETDTEHKNACLLLQAQSIRICYLAMLYDTGAPLPIPGVDGVRGPEVEISPSLQSAVEAIQSALSHDTPEVVVTLANDLVEAVCNITGSEYDDRLNIEITTYFARAITVPDSDQYISSIREELQSRYGHYITLR